MANVMKMAIIEAIQSLRSTGLSCRAIARRLGIHRDTVARHVRVGREGDSKPATAPISPAGSDEVAGFGAPTGNLPVAQASFAAPWLPWLLEQHARGLTAKRIHQDLQAEFPEAGSVSYDSVRRLLRKQGATLPIPFRRMERNVSMTLRHLLDEMSVVRELNRAWDRHVFRGVDPDFGRRA